METTSFLSAADLSAEQRRAAELLIGHSLEPAEIVIVASALPETMPSAEARRASRATLHKLFDAIDEHGRQHGITAEEADAAIDEAMQAIRRRAEP